MDAPTIGNHFLLRLKLKPVNARNKYGSSLKIQMGANTFVGKRQKIMTDK